MRRALLSPLVFFAAAASACGPALDVDIEARAVCFEKPAIEIAGVSTGKPVTGAFELEFEDTALLARLDAEVRLDSVAFRARQLEDLSFLETVSVRARGADPRLPMLDVSSCAGSCPVAGPEVTLDAQPASLRPYLESGALEILFDFSGTLPATAWILDADVCVSATATLSESDL